MYSKYIAFIISIPFILSACETLPGKKGGAPTATAEEDAPTLTKPKVRSFIVPDAIEGNKYIKAHRVYILDDPGSWSR